MSRAVALSDVAPPGLGIGWRSARTASLVVIFAVGTLFVAHGSLYFQGLVLVAAVFAILALSLDLVAGSTGLYSLGHAGLFAFGAFGTAIISADWQWNVFLILPVVVVGVGAVGLVLGAVSLRVSGLYFAVTTFVFTLIVSILASELAITGGPQGLIGPAFPTFPSGNFLGNSTTWCVMLSLLLAIVVTWNIRNSPFYPVLLAIRDAEPYAQSVGVKSASVKIGVFGISAALAGLAGWAFAFLGVVSFGQFSWTVSVNILVMVIFGGIDTAVGPIIGAAVISIFPAYVNISPLWQEVIFGALFVVVIVAFPSGVVGVARMLRDRLFALTEKGRQQAAAAGSAAELIAAAELATSGSGVVAPEQLATVGVASVATRAGTSALHGGEPVAGNGHRAGTPAVECRGITFRYAQDGEDVLSNVDLFVEPGTIHGLIGPNGSGKSTLVDLIAGRRTPMSGTISVNGKVVTREGPDRRARYGLMRTFQSATLVGDLSVLRNVMIALYTKVPGIATRAIAWPFLPRSRQSRRSMEERSRSVLDWIGAAPWEQLRVSSLPHGAHQLTQIAAACGPQPSTLILDEPLAGLSLTEAEHVVGLLRELRDSGVSIILIEHQTRFVFSLCDTITVLSAGEVVISGNPDDVYANTRVREVYLGQ